MSDAKHIPDWAARVFGLGALIIAVSVVLSLIGIDHTGAGVVIGLVMMAIGMRGAEDALKRKREI